MIQNRGMDTAGSTLRRFARAAGEVVAETLWPTRCVLCERPGQVLCARCARNLPFLDWWSACPRCGAQYGAVQCTSCDAVTLNRLGRTALPYDGCASATVFDEATGRIVRVFKDQGEQRLAVPIAECMLRCLPPAWRFDAITYVPSTLTAYRYRGFDHARLIAEQFLTRLEEMRNPSAFCESGGSSSFGTCESNFFEHPYVSACTSIPDLVCAFDRPKTRDQRKLSRMERIENLAGCFHASSETCMGRRILVIDDVSTTGATLFAASDALRFAGASFVYCMTFARV